jgi:hypothetical protein
VGYKSLTDTTLPSSAPRTSRGTTCVAHTAAAAALHRMLRDGNACHQLGPFCTRDVMDVQIYATRRSLNSRSFYGLGAASPRHAVRVRRKRDLRRRLGQDAAPNWLRTDGQFELRDPALTRTHRLVQSSTASMKVQCQVLRRSPCSCTPRLHCVPTPRSSPSAPRIRWRRSGAAAYEGPHSVRVSEQRRLPLVPRSQHRPVFVPSGRFRRG